MKTIKIATNINSYRTVRDETRISETSDENILHQNFNYLE